MKVFMNKKYFLSVFFFLFSFISMKGQDFTIKIPSNIPDKMVYIKDYFTTINYLPLETTDECLIGSLARYNIIEDYILVTSNDHCYLFNLSNGKFIREIGKRGNGPGEYRSGQGYYNPYSKTIYFPDWNSGFLKYSLEGKLLSKITIPEHSSSLEYPSFATTFSFISEDLICAFFLNINGAESKRVMIFSESGEIIKLFPNNRIIKTNASVISIGRDNFYRNNNKLFFKEEFVDTVYTVTKEKLSPAYIIDQGKFKIKYENRYDNPFKFQPVTLIMENNNYVILQWITYGEKCYTIYDKNNNICNSYVAKEGFIDNINNFMPFLPTTVSYDGAFVSILEAFKVVEVLEKNKMKNNPGLAPLLKVNEYDNPILIIAR